MRHRADDNQKKIVSGLRNIGATVVVLSQVGAGCPDIMVGFRGETFLFEIKGEKGKLSESQENWRLLWRGGHAAVARSLGEVIEEITKRLPK